MIIRGILSTYRLDALYIEIPRVSWIVQRKALMKGHELLSPYTVDVEQSPAKRQQ